MVALLHLSGFHQEDKLPNLIMQHKLSVLHLLYGYHYVINMNYTLAVADNSTMYIEQVWKTFATYMNIKRCNNKERIDKRLDPSWRFEIRRFIHSYIHSFISGMHHYECVAPNVDINLQSGQFWATSIASFRERFIDFRFCWVVFIHVVWGRPGGLLQFSKGEAVMICLASDSSGIRAMWPSRERCCAWTAAERCGCLGDGVLKTLRNPVELSKSLTGSGLW